MHYNKVNSSLFTPENIKCVEINNGCSNPNQQKNLVNGIRNARKLLDGLQRSLNKSGKYEDGLLRCKATHAHSHDWWESDRSEEKDDKCSESETSKPPRGQVNIAESWSTISIVCLQYQYEELSKKYAALLHAYHESCSSASSREAALVRLRAHTRLALAHLAHAHKTLIAVGDKYLSLQRKKQMQKKRYEARVKQLKATVRGVMAMCEHARLQLDTRIARFMHTEKDAPNAQLLAEIRKCNLLFLENLRLKAQIEELTPGQAFIEKQYYYNK